MGRSPPRAGKQKRRQERPQSSSGAGTGQPGQRDDASKSWVDCQTRNCGGWIWRSRCTKPQKCSKCFRKYPIIHAPNSRGTSRCTPRDRRAKDEPSPSPRSDSLPWDSRGRDRFRHHRSDSRVCPTDYSSRHAKGDRKERKVSKDRKDRKSSQERRVKHEPPSEDEGAATQRLAAAKPDFFNKLSSVLDECPEAGAAKETFLAALAKKVAPPPPPEPTPEQAKEKDRAGLEAARSLVLAADRKNDKADKHVLNL